MKSSAMKGYLVIKQVLIANVQDLNVLRTQLKLIGDESLTTLTAWAWLESKNCQDQLLASLIKVCDVARRRSRKEDWTEANWHNKSFRYYIRNSEAAEIEVCIKGFCSLFGITENRVRRIREYLRDTG